MLPPSRDRPAHPVRALLLVGLLLAAGLVPLVASDPAQDLVDDLFGRAEGAQADAEKALAAALERLDPVQAKLDEALKAIDDAIADNVNPDLVLAPYFLDQNFDQGPAFSHGETARRLGGWGDWQATGDVGWRHDPRAPRIGEQGLGFWDGNPQTGRYPIAGVPLDAYAVSPRISLRALSVYGQADAGLCVNPGPRCAAATIDADAAAAPEQGLGGAQTGVAGLQGVAAIVCTPADDAAAGGQCAQAASGEALEGQSLSATPGEPHRIQLRVQHRFNFATSEADGLRTGTDGGRVELYTCKPGTCLGPSEEDLLAFRDGRPLSPGLAARVVRPLTLDPDLYQPTSAFGGGPAFSGPSADPEGSQSTFDLTPWAGQDAWLVFHAATTAKGQSAASYFAPTGNSHFDTSRGHFGWTLNEVYVAGPAWQHDVRIDAILDPSFRAGPGQYKASEGPNAFAVLLLNRGTVEETVRPRLTVEDRADAAQRQDCTPAVPDVTLRAGDIRRITFTDCIGPAGAGPGPLVLVRDHDYQLAFTADLATDLHPADNARIGLSVHAEPLASARLVEGSLTLQPSVGDDTQPRTLRFVLENPGLSPARVTATLAIAHQLNPNVDEWVHDRADPRYPRVGANVGDSPHVVSVSADRLEQVAVIPVGDGVTPSRVPLSWTLTLPARGNYRVHLVALQQQSGTPVIDAALQASTFLAAPSPFLDDFGDVRKSSIVEGPEGSPWRDWTTESVRDLPPPQCADPDAAPFPCPLGVWEISGREPDRRVDLAPTDDSRDPVRQASKPHLCPRYAGSDQPVTSSYPCSVYVLYSTTLEQDGTPPTNYVLTGRPRLDTEAIVANQRFSRLRVDYQMAFEDLHRAPFIITGPLGPATVSLDAVVDSVAAHDPVPSPVASTYPANWMPVTRQRLAVVADLPFPTGAGADHLMRYLDGQWLSGSQHVDPPAGSYSAAEVQAMALAFRLPLPGDRYTYIAQTDSYRLDGRGCPLRADDPAPVPDYCPTWRIAHAALHGQDAATGEWLPLARFTGRPDETLGQWASFAETAPGRAVTCAQATLPQGEEFSCLGFHQRAVSTLVPPPTRLRRDEGLDQVTRARGFWTNMEPDGFGNLHYSGDEHSRLLSPALRVPAGDGDPANNARLQFSQLHRFVGSDAVLPPGSTVGADQTSLDGVTLFVRRLANDGAGIHPTTPFLPVYPGVTAPTATQTITAFGRSRPTADHVLIGNTAPVNTVLDLGNVRVLDYRDRAPVVRPATNPPTATALTYTYDADAFETWDLTANGGQLVQFAFQLDAGGAPMRGGCVQVTPPGSPQPVCDQFGWLLDDFEVAQNPRSAYDVAVVAADLQAIGYDQRALGLGPSTQAVVNVQVQNNGLFTVEEGHVEVILHGRDGTRAVHRLEPDTFAMRPPSGGMGGESRTFAVPIPALPALEQEYAIVVRVGLDGLLLDAGTDPATYLDEKPDDNCAVLNPTGPAQTVPCGVLDPDAIDDQPTFVVQAVEDLRVSFSVTPEQGRVGFARNLDVFVENRGNVVVHDAQLALTTRNLQDPSDRSTDTWTIRESPQPGERLSWSAVKLDKPAIGGLRLLQTARYLLSVAVTKDGDPPLESLATRIVASFDTFYSDDFAGGLDSQHPAAVHGELSAVGDWTLEQGLNTYLDPACCAWHFGSLKNGTYPNGADAMLLFPTVDLSTASKAVFSFAHRHLLEDGFDGARLEASTDGGATWRALTPFVPSATAQDCPSGMVLLPLSGGPLCAVPQSAGACPSGTVTGTQAVSVLGMPVCAIAPSRGECPTGQVHAAFQSGLACAVPIRGAACPFSLAFVPVYPGVCAQQLNSGTCAAGQAVVTNEGVAYCATIPSGQRCPEGTVGLTVAQRDCFVPAGYGALLQAGTALHHPDPAQRDPARLVSAFSGDSHEVAALQDGWRISEFDLAQIPGFTLPVELVRLEQEEFPAFASESPVRPAGRRTSVDAWCDRGKTVQDGVDADHCWLRENVPHDDPPANPQALADGVPQAPGHEMWWSGTSDFNWDPNAAAQRSNPRAVLNLRLPDLHTCAPDEDPGVRCLGQGERARLVYWVYDTRPAALAQGVCGEGLTVVPNQGQILATHPSGWVQRAITVQSANFDATRIRDVTFTYADPNDRWAPGSGTARFCNMPLRGMAIDDVRIEIVRTASGRDTVQREGPKAPLWLPPASPQWTASQLSPYAGDLVRWRPVERLPAVPDAWDPHPVAADHDGDPATVWLFGDAAAKRYPINARERLVTPTISLQEIGGSTASLTFWERFDIDLHTASNAVNGQQPYTRDTRRVLVQSYLPTADGMEEWGPWVTINTYAGPATRSTTACPEAAVSHQWCKVTVDVSTLIGQKVRFGFEVASGRRNVPHGTFTTPIEPDLGVFWMVDDIGITAASLAGGPVQLRLHVATDGSLNEGGLSVDNPQLVGFQYARNVAVVPDAAGTVYGATGSTVRIDGAVRNLAEGLETDLVVEARAVHVSGCQPSPPLQPLPAERSQARPGPAEAGWARSEPFSLTPAGTLSANGQPNDRVRFAFDLPLPSGECLSSTFRIELRALQATPAGPVAIADDNLGDHERALPLVVANTDDLEVPPSRLAVDPRSAWRGADGTAPLALRAYVENAGTTHLLGLDVEFQPTRTPIELGLDEAYPPVRVSVPAADLPAPGQGRWVNATWAAPADGFYAVTAQVTGRFASGPFPLPAVTVGHALVGHSALYWSDDLEGDLAGWAPTHADPRAVSARCGPAAPGSNGAPPANAPAELGWQRSEARAFDGRASFFVGTTDPGTPYPAQRDEVLRAPAVDLAFLRNAAGSTDNPFIPDLTFRYMPLFGDPTANPNNGMLVQATARSTDGTVAGPETQRIANYDGRVKCDGVRSNPLVLQERTFLLSTSAYRGQADGVWRPGSVRQGYVSNPAGVHLAPVPLAGSLVEPSFRFGTGDSLAQGVFVDSVSLSAYRSSVSPARQDVDLVTGAVKDFNFLVTNTGVARDNFTVALDLDATHGREFIDAGPGGAPLVPIDILTPVLDLPAGASGIARVRVRVPSDPGLPLVTAGDIVLAVASSTDPNQVSTATVHVGQITPVDLPHLAVELRRPGDDGAVVSEQEPVSFLAVVRNDGRAPALATDLAVIACPSTRGQPGPDLAACLEARREGRTGDAAWPTLLKSANVPGLPSPADVPREQLGKTVHTRTVSWVPPIGKPGLYRIVAIADTRGTLRQYDPPGVASLDLTVQPLQRPDLVVGDLRVLDAAGREVSEAFAGDLLRVTGTVRNEGLAAAHDVEASLTAQHELLAERIGTLEPGQSRTLSTTWIAAPGNYLVALEAYTTTPLDDLANNAVRAPVGIRQGVLEATLAPDVLDLRPGESRQVLLELRNRRDAAVALELPAQAPEGVLLHGLPASLALARGAAEQVSLTVAASPLAAEGAGEVRIHVRSADGVALAQAVLPVAVAREQRVTLAADPVYAPPGHAQGVARLRNGGEDTNLVLAATAPPGWTVVLPVRQVPLAAGADRLVQVEIDIPPATAPGRHEVQLLSGLRPLGNLAVEVTPRAAWHSTLDAVRQLPGRTQAVALVTNIGNAPGTPPFGGDLAAVAIHPAPAPMAPGERQAFRIELAGDGAAAQALLPGAGQGLPVAVLDAPEAVQLVRWDLSPGAGLRQGEALHVRATVRNPGDRPLAEVPVRLYADGVLVATERVALEAGAERVVELAHRPGPGEHVLVLAAGDGTATARSALLDVEARAAGAPAPAAALLALALLLAVAARRRRRA